MDRRSFLRSALAGAAVGIVAGPELIELLAPKRTIFLPPADGWHSATAEEIVADIRACLGGMIADATFRHAVLRNLGETDAQLRNRMMVTLAKIN